MIKIAIAFLLGTLSVLTADTLPPLFWSGIMLCLLIVSLLKRNGFVIAFIVGALGSIYQAQLVLNDWPSAQQQKDAQLITGRIASLPEQQGKRLKFIFKPDHSDYPAKILVSSYLKNIQPKAGEHWQLNLKLKPPSGLMNPGGFDYEKSLFRKAISATAYVRKSHLNQRLAPAAVYDYQHWRQNLADQLQQQLDQLPSLPLILGLTLGDRSLMRAAQWQTLQRTGTSHLLAISGLHIGLAAMTLFLLWQRLWRLFPGLLLTLPARQSAALVAFGGACLYALLAGLSIPTQRALIMTGTVLAGIALRRRFFIQDLLAVSVLLILLIDPFAALSAGFYLSFFAVILILIAVGQRFPSHRWHWLKIHLWICIGMIPLSLMFFGETSLIAPVANIIAIPVIGFIIVPMLLLAIICLSFSNSLALWLFKLADLLLNYLWYGLDWLATHNPLLWQQATLPNWMLLLSLIALVILLLPRGLPGRWLATFALLPLLFYQVNRPATGEMRFTVLDVGQGLSAVVETKHHTLVFDTGRYYSPQFDMGSAVILPYLKSRGIQRVDTVIISHSDLDHRGGLHSLAAVMPIDQLLSSAPEAIRGASPCLSGQHWQWNEVRFEILNPAATSTASDNNRSCVLKVSSQHFSVLLTGDIEKQAEKALVERYAQRLSADILSVPHHGSRTSSTQDFINTVSPQIASFSVGLNNPYHFPAKSVLKRYLNNNITLTRTDLDGAQIFSWDKNTGIVVIKWREQGQSLWTSRPTE